VLMNQRQTDKRGPLMPQTLLQKLEVHRSLGAASPGFHLSDEDIDAIIALLRVKTMVPIERTLTGWFEASGYHVEHDGHEWLAWVGERMLPLTEIAVAIRLEQDTADAGQ
jgi:hypothetical protein